MKNLNLAIRKSENTIFFDLQGGNHTHFINNEKHAKSEKRALKRVVRGNRCFSLLLGRSGAATPPFPTNVSNSPFNNP
jgi:hypothetical protein